MPSGLAPPARLTSIDALRGAVMIIMALDHTRDFFHAGAMLFSPEDLSRTTSMLFFTRWVTHICAPVFVFLAGVGAWLRLERDGSKARLSRFLWTRGLWLVLIELTVMRVAMNFTVDSRYPILLLILWALGISMVAMAALVHLPIRALAVLAVAVIALHNTLDGIHAAQMGAFGSIWSVLHQQGVFTVAGAPVFVAYPVLPWIGVMALGFCIGPVFRLEAVRRQRWLAAAGVMLIVGFVGLRFANVYGDPSPWSPQPSGVFTALSFLRTTKYPPSLQFIAMTLGPALVALAWLDRRQPGPNHPVAVIGRVPFFFYVTHFWALHVVSSLASWLRYGSASFGFLLYPLPSMGGPRDVFPPAFGYTLGVTFVVWVGVVVALYPLCRWFAGIKARRRDWWASYL